MYLFSLVFAVLSGAVYHVSQKNIPKDFNPARSLMITFSVALMGSVVWFLVTKEDSESLSMTSIPWSSILLGLCVIGLEFSILMAYRSGWEISSFNLVYSLMLIILLIPIGVIAFKEVLSFKTLIGVIISIGGIILVK